MENKQWPLPPYNDTFDCVIHIETELPKGEKSGEKYDALSLIIIELNYSSHRDGRRRAFFIRTCQAKLCDRMIMEANLSVTSVTSPANHIRLQSC